MLLCYGARLETCLLRDQHRRSNPKTPRCIGVGFYHAGTAFEVAGLQRDQHVPAHRFTPRALGQIVIVLGTAIDTVLERFAIVKLGDSILLSRGR